MPRVPTAAFATEPLRTGGVEPYGMRSWHMWVNVELPILSPDQFALMLQRLNPQVGTLDINVRYLDVDSCALLVAWINVGRPMLTELHVSGYHRREVLGFHLVDLFAALPRLPNLEKFVLEQSDTSSAQFVALLDAATLCPKLRILLTQHSEWNVPTAVLARLDAFVRTNTTMEELYLPNLVMTEQSICELLRAVATNKTLADMSIGPQPEGQITTTLKTALADMWASNRCLRYFRIRGVETALSPALQRLRVHRHIVAKWMLLLCTTGTTLSRGVVASILDGKRVNSDGDNVVKCTVRAFLLELSVQEEARRYVI